MTSLSWKELGRCAAIIALLTHQSIAISQNEDKTRADISMSDIDMEMSTYTCGETTMAKEFHFVSPAYPVSVGLGNLTCQLTIDHGCPKMGAKDGSAICQIRLDFEQFNILFLVLVITTSSMHLPMESTLFFVGTIQVSICILMFLEGQQLILHSFWMS